jgi:hypothetical protein
MRARHLLVTLLALVPLQLAPTCTPGGPDIVIQSPGTLVSNFDFQVQFELIGSFVPGSLVVALNFTPLPVSGGPVYTATVHPGPPLLDHNVLIVKARRSSDNVYVTRGLSFDYLPPKARAFHISDASVLPHGPLAHGKVGDYMLENSEARFVVQDVNQRDFYSVGAFGGNIIDAVRIGDTERDNFYEMTPMLNIETVINAVTLEIVNDGQDGTAAIIRTCGPDDLLDFVNPSGQIRPFAPTIIFPPAADDNNQPIEGCTEYKLSPLKSYVAMETTVENMGGTPLKLFVGDWMNASGELEQWVAPGAGLGEGLFGELQTITHIGYGEAQGIDYSYVSVPTQEVQTPTDTVEKSNFFNTSGVSVILNNMDIIAAVAIGAQPPFTVPAGGTRSYLRYFGVGDGSGGNTTDIRNEVFGTGTGTLAGCVTVGGTPAPGARIAVGQPINLVTLTSTKLITNVQTGPTGCYSVTLPAGSYDVAASKRGVPYEGGGAAPLVTTGVAITVNNTTTKNFALPATGRLHVEVTDAGSAALPARVSVVGFDPSPEPRIPGTSLFGFSGGALSLFNDPTDRAPFGLTSAAYTGASGIAEFDLEPGTYHVYVSRGTEYSLFTTAPSSPVTVVAGSTANVSAQIAPVLDTTGFVSSDFHVHGIASADSPVSDTNRALQFSGEGVDNVIMTDHHVHKDLNPRIAALGLASFLKATVGEEITTFDYGHFNGYPYTVNPNLASGGSTDWGIAEPPGEYFPSLGAYTATPAQIHLLGTTQPTAMPDTTVQINHIGSHFAPLKIDTSLVPPVDAMSAADRLAFRIDPAAGNLFHHFPALECWNGSTRGHQGEFLNQRIGIWFNHLNQGLRTTMISDTDTHSFENLRTAGARSWTPSPTGDAPADIVPANVAQAVDAGKAVGGQGVYVQTRLVSVADPGQVANLTWDGTTTVSDPGGELDLEIDVQSPIWAEYDRIEIYANAATVKNSVTTPGGSPYLFSAVPTATLNLGTNFTRSVVPVAAVPGGSRFETHLTLRLPDDIPAIPLTQDTWIVVIVKGSDGISKPMFPVFADDLATAGNTTLANLVDGNLGQNGVMALGVTNALYYDAP